MDISAYCYCVDSDVLNYRCNGQWKDIYYVYASYFSEPECWPILVCQYAIVLNNGSSFDDGCELWHCIKNNNIILGTKYNICKYTGYVVFPTITVLSIL